MKKMFFALLMLPMLAMAGSVEPPSGLTAKVCEERIAVDGMQIARLRWEHGWKKQQLLDIPFTDEAPDWMVALIKNWIEDAYAWEGDGMSWLRKIHKECQSIQAS